MYQINVDGFALYDPRDSRLIVSNPKCKLGANTVGEASFSIYATHPNYNRMKKLRSVFEILQDGTPIFRGRMTDDSKDINNTKAVDLEGVMAYFNDSVIEPFDFPDSFPGASSSDNEVEFFLNWLIEQHNSQVEPFQQFRLGRVTVRDPANLTRSLDDYTKTWEVLKTRLFDSSLGGYLCIRYQYDGAGKPVNYIDYLEDFKTDDGAILANPQRITFGKNLLDLVQESDASETYSAVIPRGMKISEITEGAEDDSRLTIADLPNGIIQETAEGGKIIKKGIMIYSEKAVEEYGFICAPPSETIYEDVKEAETLRTYGVDFLVNTGIRFLNTITIKAADLHFSNDEIEAFRIYRYVLTDSAPHGLEDYKKLEQLDIDILNPQNTVITIGETHLSLTDINAGIKQNVTTHFENVTVKVKTQVKEAMETQTAAILADCEKIILESMKEYVETGDFEEYRETVASQLTLLADQMSLKFTETISRIEEVDGDLQEKFNTITKYFTFDINGLTIGQADNPNKVVIDNDEISILVNGVVVQKFDAQGRALIPELTVTNKLYLFGYLIDEDSEGRVNCEYVGSGVGTVALITFTVDGEEYQAEEGMTWQRFIYSDYNNGIFNYDEIMGVTCYGNPVCNSEDNLQSVEYTGEIISGHAYATP